MKNKPISRGEIGGLLVLIGIFMIVVSYIAKFLIIVLSILSIAVGIILIFELDKEAREVIQKWKRKKK